MPAEVWLSEDAKTDIERLDPTQRRKLDWWAKRLSEDVTVGDHVRRDLIPDKLRRKYNVDNLWRVELPGGWRALYTVASAADRPLTVSILRIIDHGEYDRLFGYSTS